MIWVLYIWGIWVPTNTAIKCLVWELAEHKFSFTIPLPSVWFALETTGRLLVLTKKFPISHVSIVCLHNECVNGSMQVSKHFAQDGAHQEEDSRGWRQHVAWHPLKSFKQTTSSTWRWKDDRRHRRSRRQRLWRRRTTSGRSWACSRSWRSASWW